MVEQAKGAEGAINVSDIIKPALARGDLQMIGATTWREYELYIKPDTALDRRLQPVIVGEPSEETALQIIQSLKDAYERYHKVQYTDGALKAAVVLSGKYIKNRFLPDKAVDLIDEAGAKVAIEAGRGMSHAIALIHAAGADVQARLAALAHEEQRLTEEIAHMRAIEQEVKGDSELAAVRGKLEQLIKELKKVEESLKNQQAVGVPQVTEQDIREVVAEWVGRPIAEIV